MSRPVNDVRFAVRTLLRAPAYSLTVVLTLALGIGAATAIFSFVHGLLLRPLSYPDADRLVMVWQDHRAVGGPADEWFTPPDFVDLREQSTTLTAVSGLQNSSLTLTTGDGAEIVTGAGVPVGTLTTLRQLIAQSIAVPRLITLLFGVFAASALLLAAIGVYGVMASAVGARTREIGVRIALGAAPGSVRRIFVRRALGLIALGAAFGIAGALAAGRALGALLYEVAPADPGAIAAVVALLGGVAFAAGYLPARRASRVEPMRVLRQD